MRTWCDTSKGKDKTMCYYMGVGDAEQGTSGGVKRDISSSLTRGINAKRLCAPHATHRSTRTHAHAHREAPPRYSGADATSSPNTRAGATA